MNSDGCGSATSGLVSSGSCLVTEIGRRLDRLRIRLDAAGGEHVTLVGVTKTFGRDVVQAAIAAGVCEIGESYAQEAREKLPGLDPVPRVHFIGRLQRNKVRVLAGIVDVWQSVDRAELGAEIARRVPGATVMMQINISEEPTRGGVAPAKAEALLETLLSQGLNVIGVMGIAPLAHPDEARHGFRRLRAFRDGFGLAECSMGMSTDLEIAVREGSTMVRVGTDLLGSRNPKAVMVP